MGIVRMGPPAELISKLKQTRRITTFIETGTYYGNTAYWASSVFDHVITIEASESLYKKVTKQYGHIKNIEFIYGDSRERLIDVVASLDGPGIFWLDAHYSGGETYGQTVQEPVVGEIEAINRSKYEHFILVGDARLSISPPPGHLPIDQWPNITAVTNALQASEKERYIVIIEDVIVAVPSFARMVLARYCQKVNARLREEYSSRNKIAQNNSAKPPIVRKEKSVDELNSTTRQLAETEAAPVPEVEEATDIYGQPVSQGHGRLLKHRPNGSKYAKLAYSSRSEGRLSEATEYQRKAVQAEPDNAEYLGNLGTLLISTGQIKNGISLSLKSVEKAPRQARIHSSFLANLHYLPNLEPAMLFDEHKKWGRIHAPASRAKVSHNNTAEPDRRLRIGYISPDFCMHSVTYFFELLLDGHNHEAVEVYGYGSVAAPDEVTEWLKGKFNHYRNVRGVGDEAVAGMIEQDKIDILVELAGHMTDNRLSVLAYKPAPIQVTYLGYPDTTGMQAIDYRLTDSLVDPPESQQFYIEELVFLPEGFLCYRPGDAAPPVAPLPAARKGYITFGSFNNNCKINPPVMALWAEILKANDNSRLLLKFNGGGDHQVKDHYLQQFEQLGIPRDRVDIYGWEPIVVKHLQLYSEVDIALDTYPYNGTTTTCEAMWMGVPTISLVGGCHASRVGLSILTRVGMEFFAASTPSDYIARATALAGKSEALAKIRASMRKRMAASTLCGAKSFTHGVEMAYRKMWHRWCQRQGVDVPSEEPRQDAQRAGADVAVCSSNSTDNDMK